MTMSCTSLSSNCRFHPICFYFRKCDCYAFKFLSTSINEKVFWFVFLSVSCNLFFSQLSWVKVLVCHLSWTNFNTSANKTRTKPALGFFNQTRMNEHKQKWTTVEKYILFIIINLCNFVCKNGLLYIFVDWYYLWRQVEEFNSGLRVRKFSFLFIVFLFVNYRQYIFGVKSAALPNQWASKCFISNFISFYFKMLELYSI